MCVVLPQDWLGLFVLGTVLHNCIECFGSLTSILVVSKLWSVTSALTHFCKRDLANLIYREALRRMGMILRRIKDLEGI